MKKKVLGFANKLLVPAIFVLLSIFAFVYIANYTLGKKNLSQRFEFGVTFSDKYARYLGFEAEAMLDEILNDLNVKNFRLPVYWDTVEPKKDQFNFTNLDKYIEMISKEDGKIILAIGYKVPRWPECHAPSWAKDLSKKEFEERQLKMMQTLVQRYDKNPNIIAWQVENELFMDFGECPKFDRSFIEKEVALVKKLSNKSVIMTDSGEVRPWISPARLGDILGISLYRIVYHHIFGTLYYPLPPLYYSLKSYLVHKFFAPNNQKTIILELQGEAWVKDGVLNTPIDEQVKGFSLELLAKNIEFAKEVGFQEIYLWGVEWWYYLKVNGHPEYWDFAKEIFK